MTKRAGLIVTLAVLGLAIVMWANNTSVFAHKREPLKVLAHRGIGQTTSKDLGSQGCFATAIDPPRHDFVENTIPSMRQAFASGADGVEVDVHPTTDNEFVVFHDWTLDCATNGHGVTREQDSRTIQGLDPAYYYTADDGRTYPLRGRWTGQIPLLSQVLQAFPDQLIFINIKSADPTEGDRLADYLRLHEKNPRRLYAFGASAPIERLRAGRPEVRAFSKRSGISDLLTYEFTGWTGYIPGSMRGNVVGVPLDRARLLWGWPARFSERMRRTDTSVLLVKSSHEFAQGVNDPADLRSIPEGIGGFVVTDQTVAIHEELARLGRLAH